MEDDRPAPERMDELIRQIAAEPPAQALGDLTNVANRAIIELHKLARQEANARRGQADWGKWARLANAVRSGVLQIAAVRDSVKGIGSGDKDAAR
jgi:hypothetical protein